MLESTYTPATRLSSSISVYLLYVLLRRSSFDGLSGSQTDDDDMIIGVCVVFFHTGGKEP